MKKILTLSTMLLFAIAFGPAFAGEYMAGTMDSSGGLYNGVTHFDLGPTSCAGINEPSEGGSGAGGSSAEDLNAVPGNGATFFDIGKEGSGSGDYCEGKPSREIAASGSVGTEAWKRYVTE